MKSKEINRPHLGICIVALWLFTQPVFCQYAFKIEGTINSQDKGIVIRLTTNLFDSLATIARYSSIVNIKTVPVNGKFSFSGIIPNKFEFVTLTVIENDEIVKSWNFFVSDLPESIHILSLNVNINPDIRFENVPFIKEMNQYAMAVDSIHDSNLRASLGIEQQKRNERDSIVYYKRIAADRLMTARINYIKSNLNSYFSLYIFDKDLIRSIQGIHLTADLLMGLFNQFNSTLKDSKLGKNLYKEIKKREGLSIGQRLPEFSFITNDSKKYLFSEVAKSKFTLLCFWATYCGPCIRSIPYLKHLDSLYKSKGLELVSVSIDASIGEWQSYLRKYQMQWKQTVDLPSFIDKSQDLQNRFGLSYIPQYFLVDENRKILYHNIQSADSDDYRILYELLNKLLRKG